MPTIKYSIHESGYVAAYGTVSDSISLVGNSLTKTALSILSSALETECIQVTIGLSDLIGVFSRMNSNGILVSNIITDGELQRIKAAANGLNVGVLRSGLNAIGNNILANDKIAIVNPDYNRASRESISDILGVEVVSYENTSFKTVGSNNILTNKGLLINNRSSDEEKEYLDGVTGMDSMRTTANTGSLSIGLSVLANSHGAVIGSETTGFELARIMEALDINGESWKTPA